MARYLRQLAEQAIGPAPALRSAMAAAFAPEPAVAGDEVDPILAPALATEGPRTTEAVVSEPRSLRTIAASPDSPSKSPDTKPAGAVIATTTAASGNPPPSAGDHEPAPATARGPAPPAAGRNRPSISSRRAPSVATTERPPHGEQAITSSTEPSSPTAGATLRPAPPPVREGQARPAAARARVEPAAAQAPDIHIHIGRIELTAATPAAAAKRTAAPGAKPMTLDAYLRQRGRKAP
jgi:hypothetical protein